MGKERENLSSYTLLHSYAQKNIIPLIIKNDIKVSTVELTTCGLLSDLLTGFSGASNYFIMGMIPYSNDMKIKIGFPQKELLYGGYGVVSKQAAETLARCILVYTGADIGIAETGLLTSSELKKKRTRKEAGCVYTSIISKNDVLCQKLSVQKDLPRGEMRKEIAFRVLCLIEEFLNK
ncbi:MAG: CinA family protein [Candidatus Hodarchaeales archaeon]